MGKSETSLTEELARLAQALEDISACSGSSVSMIRCSSAARERRLVGKLAERARQRGFLTSTISLREERLDSPETLVRATLGSLVRPGESRSRDLLWLLECFYDIHGDHSSEEFVRNCHQFGAEGDLTALCATYLATDDPEAPAERRAYGAWLAGVRPPKKYRNPQVRRALTGRTAQRALSEFTRIVLALGYRGLVLQLAHGEAIASRTARQREKAYTVLRELVDNFDGNAGTASTRVIITGQEALFDGERSIRQIAPLHMRLQVPAEGATPPPHRSMTACSGAEATFRRRIESYERSAPALTNLIRISEGLPPVHKVTRMSVGQERLDRTIQGLFDIVKRSGSFFSVLVGEYGSGKTHLMMHLAERALEDNRPVFWLNLERTNLDLGNPARHLSRLLEHSELPLRGRPSAFSLARKWTKSAAAVKRLRDNLEAVAEGDGQAAVAAEKALRVSASARDPGLALENFLGAHDLAARPGDAVYRQDAYRRLFLWLELLSRQEDINGPVVLIDEAENLYTSGRAPASRRTSLRSLAFYCGGALPRTCVIMGMTPPAFSEMKREARELLSEASEIESTLDLENVDKFRKTLWRLKPDPIAPLKRSERIELCDRVRSMHRSVRGAVAFDDWNEYVRRAVREHESPRTLVRAAVDELESRWWRP